MSTSDQKLYTEFWLSPLPFWFWLDGTNSRFKRHLDNKWKERFYNQRVPKSKCRITKTIDKDIIITYRWQKIPTAYYNNEWPPRRARHLKQFCQFLFSQTVGKFHVNKKLQENNKLQWNSLKSFASCLTMSFYLIIFLNNKSLYQKLESWSCRNKITYC